MTKKLFIFTVVLLAVPQVVFAGSSMSRPYRDDYVESLLGRGVSEVIADTVTASSIGDSQTVLYGSGENITNAGGRTDTELQDFFMGEGANVTGREEYIPGPSFFKGGRGGQMVRVGDTVYVLERASGLGQSDRFGALNLNQEKWVQLASTPYAIDDQGAIGNYGDTIVVAFPQDDQADQTLLYDISEDVWAVGADMPSELLVGGGSSNGGMNGLMPVYGDSMYYAGGFEDAGRSNATIIYNVPEDTWVVGPNLPNGSDLGSMSSVYEAGPDTHYIFMQSGEIDGTNEDDGFYRLHIEADTWTQLDDIPTPLDGEGGHFVPGIFGGTDYDYVAWVTASRTGIPGVLGFYRINDRSWHLYGDNPSDWEMNQVSLALLGTRTFGGEQVSTTLFSVMVSTNQLYYDGYKILRFTIKDAE